MEPHWKFYAGVDFSDKSVLQFHVDTRDFCVAVNTEALRHDFDLAGILRHKERFFYTYTEVVDMLDRYFRDTGGQKDWRLLSLKGTGAWLKYIRIYRHEAGLIVCDSNNEPLSKILTSKEVEKQYGD